MDEKNNVFNNILISAGDVLLAPIYFSVILNAM